MKADITPEQGEFIKNNYIKMRDSDIARHLNVRVWYVLCYRRAHGFIKPGGYSKKQTVVRNGFFNVDAFENWVA